MKFLSAPQSIVHPSLLASTIRVQNSPNRYICPLCHFDSRRGPSNNCALRYSNCCPRRKLERNCSKRPCHCPICHLHRQPESRGLTPQVFGRLSGLRLARLIRATKRIEG